MNQNGVEKDACSENDMAAFDANALQLKLKPVKDVSSGWQSGFRVVSALTFFSRLLGLARDIGMAVTFGNGMVMDAFSVAFRIPNLTRRLFGEGALTAAFLPIFIRTREEQGPPAGWQLASAVLNLLILILAVLVVVSELLLWILRSRISWSPPAELLIALTMIMLPYLILICVAAQVCAILQALEHFTWPAFLPVILNVVWLGMIWFVAQRTALSETRIYWIAAAIVLAGVLQLLAPLPKLQSLGFCYQFGWSQASGAVRAIISTLVPVLIGLSITQLNSIADSLIAWCFAQPEGGAETIRWLFNWPYPLEIGSAAALYFGQRIYQFPLGVFGVALGTVLFPRFSQHATQNESGRLQRDLLLGMKLVLGVGLPASAGLVLIAKPLTTLLFQHGAFDAQDALQTSGIVSAYGLAVWAYCGLLIVNRAYYALDDQQTPLRVGLVAVVLNLVLNFSLIWLLGAAGLAVATSFSAIVQLIVLVKLLEGRVGQLMSTGLFLFTLKAVLASSAMFAAGWFVLGSLSAADAFVSKMLRVLVPVGLSVVVYFASARLLKMRELSQLWQRTEDAG